MPQLSFKAQISDFVAQSQARINAVVAESAQRIIGIMQTPVGAGGAMPILTGYLRSSLQVTIGAPVPASRARPEGETFAYDAAPIALTIAGAPLGTTIFAAYGANYAGHVEYGTSKMQGRGFVRLAAMQWQTVVSEVSAELKTRIEAA